MAVTLTGQNVPSGGAPFATDNTTTGGGRVVLVKAIFGQDGTIKFIDDATGLRLPVKAVQTDASDAEVKTGDSALSAQRVTVVGGAQVAALQIDNAPFTTSTDGGVPAFVLYNDAVSDLLTQGDAGIARGSKDRLLHILGAPRAQIAKMTIALTSTAETTILPAAAAGVYHDLSYINFSSSNTTTPVVITLRDATGGPAVWQTSLSEKGGSNNPIGIDNWPQTSPAANWTAQLSAAISTVYINVLAVKRLS